MSELALVQELLRFVEQGDSFSTCKTVIHRCNTTSRSVHDHCKVYNLEAKCAWAKSMHFFLTTRLIPYIKSLLKTHEKFITKHTKCFIVNNLHPALTEDDLVDSPVYPPIRRNQQEVKFITHEKMAECCALVMLSTPSSDISEKDLLRQFSDRAVRRLFDADILGHGAQTCFIKMIHREHMPVLYHPQRGEFSLGSAVPLNV